MTGWKIKDAFESGLPVPVNLTTPVVKRLKHLRDQWLENTECEAKLDPKTGEVYLLPTGNVYDPDKPAPAPRAPKHGKPRASRTLEPAGKTPQASPNLGTKGVRKYRTLVPL